jgi:hypothetical protein
MRWYRIAPGSLYQRLYKLRIAAFSVQASRKKWDAV